MGRKLKLINFEVTEEDKQLIRNACNIKRLNMSAFIRSLVIAKSLEIVKE